MSAPRAGHPVGARVPHTSAHTPATIRNIGILAHVDAGRTSLTERLLYDTGAISTLGSVDAGSTRTDTGAIERQRGITVRSAVASFGVGGARVNLIDTPGHSDFIAEVERALGVPARTAGPSPTASSRSCAPVSPGRSARRPTSAV
ncbi:MULTISPECIES: GTP-binding protein [unclassified Streptomyces]|uniref:GTP-binding protein n=1 Tax=unclassified Streptomyces TaxID=2593676 RepID=UPI0024941E14|nr:MULTISPECIES: GTP-binding protein [unclassified Streptomyces]